MAAAKKPSQAYEGNGKHVWEDAVQREHLDGHTYRLRVPGGWLYSVVNEDGSSSLAFVPMPIVVKHKV